MKPITLARHIELKRIRQAEDETRKPRYPIGTVYHTRCKAPRECTIVDIHYTTNSKGEQVKFRYVSTHEFLGQTVYDYDVVEISVSLGNPIITKKG